MILDVGKKINRIEVKLFFIIILAHGIHWSTQIYSIIDLVEVHSGTLPYDNAAKQILCLFVCFVALRPKSTAMVIAGRSVHLTTLFPGQA